MDIQPNPNAKSLTRSWQRRLLFVLVASIILVPLSSGFMIRLSPQSPSSLLQKARAIWGNQSLTDYSMSVAFGGAFVCCRTLSFTIKNNEVANIDGVDSLTSKTTILPSEEPTWYA